MEATGKLMIADFLPKRSGHFVEPIILGALMAVILIGLSGCISLPAPASIVQQPINRCPPGRGK
jgi:hypothetical protein